MISLVSIFGEKSKFVADKVNIISPRGTAHCVVVRADITWVD